MAAKAVALKRVQIDEETAAALLAGWNLKKVDILRQPEKSCTTVELLNTDSAAVHKQVSGQTALPSAFYNFQDASSRLDALPR